ncbi:sugar phosphate isomerase/epimerase family protein [Pleomorphovibrio marinus]|uniref:sugar phosphate isomerase/epimerase family protein n=1 Tax=Pleomorphovibrio marinus TaxID=2164132 RepID=UPI000E0BA202|nr:sugar phosphate isomerase/epimerase [Pleomorphovibrio marinus]
MEKRRAFLKKAGLMSLGLSSLHSTDISSQQRKKLNIGIITNTVREEMQQDYKKALKMLADIGYEYIEGGVPGDDLRAHRQFLGEIGLNQIATGAGMSSLINEPEKTIQTAKALGAPYVICYYPWMSDGKNLSKDEVLKSCEHIDRIGKTIKDAGLHFAWHNHAIEFERIDGELIFDLMMENTDPALSSVQLDIYWIAKGGQDPVAYLRKYKGRYQLLHMKDMNNNRDEGMSCVGQGIIDFEPVIKAALEVGVKYFVVENERAIKGMDCARVSFDHLNRLSNKI